MPAGSVGRGGEPTGFYHAKANTHIRLGQALCDRFGGRVPDTLEELVTLPGVGRKTANVVLGDAFGKPSITVDAHFARLAQRFGWTAQTDPEKIEQEHYAGKVGTGFDRRTLASLHAALAALERPDPRRQGRRVKPPARSAAG